jgi:hypothetical protein
MCGNEALQNNKLLLAKNNDNNKINKKRRSNLMLSFDNDKVCRNVDVDVSCKL